jgi:hypothetical protein
MRSANRRARPFVRAIRVDRRELGSILLLSLATMGAYVVALVVAGLAMSSF